MCSNHGPIFPLLCKHVVPPSEGSQSAEYTDETIRGNYGSRIGRISHGGEVGRSAAKDRRPRCATDDGRQTVRADGLDEAGGERAGTRITRLRVKPASRKSG